MDEDKISKADIRDGENKPARIYGFTICGGSSNRTEVLEQVIGESTGEKPEVITRARWDLVKLNFKRKYNV